MSICNLCFQHFKSCILAGKMVQLFLSLAQFFCCSKNSTILLQLPPFGPDLLLLTDVFIGVLLTLE